MDEHSYWLSYDRGSKSESEVWIEDVSIDDHDGRAKTNTYLGVKDCDGPDEYVWRDGDYVAFWKHLNDLNNGKHADDVSTRKRRAELKRDVRTWMSQLECTGFQKDRVCHIIDGMESIRNGYKAEATALALISLVCNEDDYWVQRHGDHDHFGPSTVVTHGGEELELAMFSKVMADCRVTPDQIRDLRKKLEGRI